MMRRLILCLWLLAACPAAPASADARVKRQAAVAAPAPRVKEDAVPAAPVKKHAALAARAKKDAAPAPTLPAAAPRRLEDIHIEGEIPAPQVLFITARDQRRFTRFHHGRYLKTSLQVGEATPLPTRIALTKSPSAPSSTP